MKSLAKATSAPRRYFAVNSLCLLDRTNNLVSVARRSTSNRIRVKALIHLNSTRIETETHLGRRNQQPLPLSQRRRNYCRRASVRLEVTPKNVLENHVVPPINPCKVFVRNCLKFYGAWVGQIWISRLSLSLQNIFEPQQHKYHDDPARVKLEIFESCWCEKEEERQVEWRTDWRN